MAFKDIWRPRIDGVDNADSSAVNEIAEAVIKNEEAVKKNASDILNKQDKLSDEQIENIDKIPDKQNILSEEQLENIQDVPNKADKEYIDNNFANALKGNVIGQSVNLTDVSPIEHNLDVKVQSKNKVPYPYYNTVESLNGITLAINKNGSITLNGTTTAKTTIELASEKNLPVKLEIGKTYTISGCPKGGNFTTAYALLLQTDRGFQSTSEIGEGKTIVAQYENYSFYIKINQGVTVENLTFYPQIEEGSVVTDYTPYMADVSGVWVEVTDDSGRYEEILPTDGTLEVNSSYPSMSIRAMNEEAVVDVTYNKDINKAFLESQNRIAELEEKLTNAIISLGGNV